jgi:hypothetical protein
MSNPHWPLFDLCVRTPRVELRYPNDDDLVSIANLAAEGIHDLDAMPFYEPWSRAKSPELERGMLQHMWSRRASLSPDDWGLPFVVMEEAESVGVQLLFAVQFPVAHTVETGSWSARKGEVWARRCEPRFYISRSRVSMLSRRIARRSTTTPRPKRSAAPTATKPMALSCSHEKAAPPATSNGYSHGTAGSTPDVTTSKSVGSNRVVRSWTVSSSRHS